jgi:hypothetical protein
MNYGGFKMEKLAVINLETGEILAERFVMIGKKPTQIDTGFIKVFVAFLEDIITKQEIAGGPIRLLLYFVKHMNYNDLTVFIDTKKVLKDLDIKKSTYHLWKKKLIKEGYIEKVNPYVYRIKQYSFVKGNMKNTLEKDLGLN